MRPPEFTGGNAMPDVIAPPAAWRASMRPPEFTGGNAMPDVIAPPAAWRASMRPPEFTGGNRPHGPMVIQPGGHRFNEAAGIHRRKRRQRGFARPGDGPRFNEAAGIHRRKPVIGAALVAALPSFNEAAGIHRRKQGRALLDALATPGGFNEAAGIHRRKRCAVPAQLVRREARLQ